MARRALAREQAVAHGGDTVVRDGSLGAPGLAYGAEDLEAPRKGRRGRGGRGGHGGHGGHGGGRWAGSGGRWWIWMGRAVLWALIIVILVNGVRAPFERFTEDGSGTGTPSRQPAASRFPTALASAFALQFGNVYLNLDQQTAPERDARLKPFLPAGSIGQFGWNELGTLQVQSVQVSAVDVRDDNNAVVTLLALARDRWLSLAVPVYAGDGAVVVSGRPALLPPPARAVPPQGGVGERDTALEGELQSQLGSFFMAYAGSDAAALSRFSDGAPIVGLNRSVAFVQLGEVMAPRGPADRRTITVNVTWRLPAPGRPETEAATLDQTYELNVVRKDGTWYVKSVQGSGRPTGS